MSKSLLVKLASVVLAGAILASMGIAQERPAHFAAGQFQKTYSDGMPEGWNIPHGSSRDSRFSRREVNLPSTLLAARRACDD
jgi:hypothetical protein